MTEQEKVWQRFNDLPEEAQRQVAEFISFLSKQAEVPSSDAVEGAEAFFGIWTDREDLAPSADWLRDLRKREWASHR